MNKTYLISRYEFLVAVKRIGFKIMTLLMPVLVILAIIVGQVVSGIVESSRKEIKTIGYVDEVGRFDKVSDSGNIKLINYKTSEQAKQSLINRDISEYFVITSDYFLTGVIKRYTLKKELTTPPDINKFIKDFLTSNLLAEKVSEEITTLINDPLHLEVTKLDKTGAKDPEQGGIENIIIPGLFAFLLAFYLNISSNTMVQGLGYEKENRVIEVLLSSVSVRQLFIGKLLGLGIAGLIQVSVWLISAQLLYLISGTLFGGLMAFIQLPSNFILLGLIYFVLGYFLFAVLSLGVGAVISNTRESTKYTLIYSLLGPFIPIWFASLLINLPDNIICIILTIFPFTAPVTTMLRLGISGVPAWQLTISIGVLVLSIIGLLFFAVKAFRISLLMYGKRPSFREIFSNISR